MSIIRKKERYGFIRDWDWDGDGDGDGDWDENRDRRIQTMIGTYHVPDDYIQVIGYNVVQDPFVVDRGWIYDRSYIPLCV